MSVTEQTIATPFGRISTWQSAGAEFPVLMIHGSGASKKAFRQQFAAPLADRFRLVALDLPGHGDSEPATGPDAYSLTSLAATVGAVVDELGLGQSAVYGWSLGGHIAIELMSFHPAVAGVMLSGTPPVSKGPLGMLRGFHAGWDMLLATKGNFNERDVERFGQLCYGDAAPAELFDDIRHADGRCRTHFSRSMLRGNGADQRRTVETARVPVAFVNGENEKTVRLSSIASLDCPMLWEGESHLVAGASHSPFLQQPAAFNALFFRFAGEVAAAAANAPRTAARLAG